MERFFKKMVEQALKLLDNVFGKNLVFYFACHYRFILKQFSSFKCIAYFCSTEAKELKGVTNY